MLVGREAYSTNLDFCYFVNKFKIRIVCLSLNLQAYRERERERERGRSVEAPMLQAGASVWMMLVIQDLINTH
jgi:hypothetical protein